MYCQMEPGRQIHVLPLDTNGKFPYPKLVLCQFEQLSRLLIETNGIMFESFRLDTNYCRENNAMFSKDLD